MINLLAALHYANINPQGPDQFKWGVTDKKEFSVKEAYKLLGRLSTITESWPWNHIWKRKSTHPLTPDKLLQLDCHA